MELEVNADVSAKVEVVVHRSRDADFIRGAQATERGDDAGQKGESRGGRASLLSEPDLSESGVVQRDFSRILRTGSLSHRQPTAQFSARLNLLFVSCQTR